MSWLNKEGGEWNYKQPAQIRKDQELPWDQPLKVLLRNQHVAAKESIKVWMDVNVTSSLALNNIDKNFKWRVRFNLLIDLLHETHVDVCKTRKARDQGL